MFIYMCIYIYIYIYVCVCVCVSPPLPPLDGTTMTPLSAPRFG